MWSPISFSMWTCSFRNFPGLFTDVIPLTTNALVKGILVKPTVASLAICAPLRRSTFSGPCDPPPSSVETHRCSTMSTQLSGLAKETPKPVHMKIRHLCCSDFFLRPAPLPPRHSNLLCHRTDNTAHLWRSEQLRQSRVLLLHHSCNETRRDDCRYCKSF